MNILQVKKYFPRIKKSDSVSRVYIFSFRKSFTKTNKKIEHQGKKQIKAIENQGKQLVEFSGEKKSLTISKQKEIFEELANEKMGEIQNLSKQIDFNNLIHYFKSNSDPKKFSQF